MTGTAHNQPDEIRYILDLHRQGMKKAEIAAKCEQRWKHRKRSSNSVGYIITKHKNDSDYAANPAPPTTALVPAISNPMPKPALLAAAPEQGLDQYTGLPLNHNSTYTPSYPATSSIQRHSPPLPTPLYRPGPNHLSPPSMTASFQMHNAYPGSPGRGYQARVDRRPPLNYQQQLALSQGRSPHKMPGPHMQAPGPVEYPQSCRTSSMDPRHLPQQYRPQGYPQMQSPSPVESPRYHPTQFNDPRHPPQVCQPQGHLQSRPQSVSPIHPLNHLSQEYNPAVMGFSPNRPPHLSNYQVPALGTVRPLTNASSPVMKQSFQKSGQKSPNNTPSSSQLHHPQTTSTSQPPNSSASFLSESPQQPRIPQITLFKPSPTGEDQLMTSEGKVFKEPLPLDGWTVAFYKKVSPPLGSLVVEFYNPQHLCDPQFSGTAINQAEFSLASEVAATSTTSHDLDTLLDLASSTPNYAMQKPVGAPSPFLTKKPLDPPENADSPTLNPSTLSKLGAPSSTPTSTPTSPPTTQVAQPTRIKPYQVTSVPLPRTPASGSLTLPDLSAKPIARPPTPEYLKVGYVLPADLKTQPSKETKEKKKSRRKTDSLPPPEPKYILDAAKTGLVTESASLKNIPGYMENMKNEVARKRAENDRKLIAEIEQENVERQQKTHRSTPVDTPSTASTPALASNDSPSPALSTSPLTPHIPNVQQSNKRKLDGITASNNGEVESTKKAKVSGSVGKEQTENQNRHQRTSSNLSVQSGLSSLSPNSASPISKDEAPSPRPVLNQWQLDQMDPDSPEVLASYGWSRPSDRDPALDFVNLPDLDLASFGSPAWDMKIESKEHTWKPLWRN